MNLYHLHNNPKSLHKHDHAYDVVPDLIKERIFDDTHTLNTAQMNTITHTAELAVLYAKDVIKDKWPPGEKAISKNANTKKTYNQLLKHKGYSDSELI